MRTSNGATLFGKEAWGILVLLCFSELLQILFQFGFYGSARFCLSSTLVGPLYQNISEDMHMWTLHAMILRILN
jgi:hypothetical protein